MYKNFTALKNLNANRTRVAVLDVEIKKLRKLAAQLQNDISLPIPHYGDDTGSIHAMGSHSDPTQRRALEDLPDDVRQLFEDIRAMTIERHRTSAWIELAEQALAFLPVRQRIIVQARAVDHLSWEAVVDEVYDKNDEFLTERTCRANFNRAMEGSAQK